jgi:hypothetical protein
MRAYYKRPEARAKLRDRVARYQATPAAKAKMPTKARAWEARNPEKYRAQKRARYALSRGYIERRGCEVCGAHAEMHHDDYSKPDEVRWLCRQHHKDAHAGG